MNNIETNNGFVYKWTNKVNKKWYIGSHNGSINDGYTASGKIIQDAFLKYGVNSFSREILYEGPNFRQEEERILNNLDAANNPMSYNLKNKAVGGDVWIGRKHTPEYTEYRKKIGSPGSSNPMYGKNHTEEAKIKMSKAKVGSTPWNKGVKNYMTDEHRKHFSRLGWEHSAETKLNMSQNRTGAKNSNAKKVNINGITYNTIKEACIGTGLTSYHITKHYKTFRD